MKYKAKSMMSLNEMVRLAIGYEGDGYVTGYPITSGDDAYILNGVIEANEEYIVINQWVPVFPESLQPVSPSLTDDQQVVLEWLKWKQQEGSQPIECLYTLAFGDAIESVVIAYINLTETEQFQVLAAFANYGLEGEG